MKTEEASGGNLNLLWELEFLGKTGLSQKELKIRGQVGEAGQNGTLSYISLIHQIKICVAGRIRGNCNRQCSYWRKQSVILPSGIFKHIVNPIIGNRISPN